MARDLGVSVSMVFAAFSAALVVSALLGPYAGRAIDRWGGRPVLMGTNLVFAAGLVALGASQGAVSLFAAWMLIGIGIGMGSGLYEAAFSALVRLYGRDSRSAITGITLLAGFASTVGWPLSTLLEAQIGWRGACLAWAALHFLIGLPLNGLLPQVARSGPSEIKPVASPGRGTTVSGVTSPARSASWLLAFLTALLGMLALASLLVLRRSA